MQNIWGESEPIINPHNMRVCNSSCTLVCFTVCTTIVQFFAHSLSGHRAVQLIRLFRFSCFNVFLGSLRRMDWQQRWRNQGSKWRNGKTGRRRSEVSRRYCFSLTMLGFTFTLCVICRMMNCSFIASLHIMWWLIKSGVSPQP